MASKKSTGTGVKIHVPKISNKDPYLSEEKLDKILDDIERDEVEDLKKSVEKAVSEAYPKERLSKTKEELQEEVAERLVREMALAVALESGESTYADVDKFTKFFTEAVNAQIRGEEPDFSDMLPPVAPEVDTAVNNYIAAENLLTNNDLKAGLRAIRKLFTPDLSKQQNDNLKFRLFAYPATYHFTESNLNITRFFTSEERSYNGKIDPDKVEQKMRRIDAEIRQLDPSLREEFVFNFVKEILSVNVATGASVWFSVNSDDFSMLREDHRNFVRDLILMYWHAKSNHIAYVKVLDKSGTTFSNEALDKLIEFGTSPSKYPMYDGSPAPHRYMNADEYLMLESLNIALFNALPNGFQETVRAAMIMDEGILSAAGSSSARNAILDSSKYLRDGFIAMVQNRGSLENFFSAVHRHFKELETELNNKVKVTSYLVGLYDSLGLSIVDVLNHSRNRITYDLPF